MQLKCVRKVQTTSANMYDKDATHSSAHNLKKKRAMLLACEKELKME